MCRVQDSGFRVQEVGFRVKEQAPPNNAPVQYHAILVGIFVTTGREGC